MRPKRDEMYNLVSGESFIVLLWLICYRESIWLLLLQPLLLPVIKYLNKRRAKRLIVKNKKGFLHLLQSLMTSLQAGYTLENACKLTLAELKKLYRNDSEPIIQAFTPLVSGIALHIPVEKLFYQLARDMQVEEIRQFATVLDIATSSGGNMVEIIRNAMWQLQNKLETEEEIRVIMSGKIYEKNIMLLMPFAVLCYLSVVNASYVSIFYSSLGGHIVISVLLAGIALCFWWTEHIMEAISFE